ncbi:RNA polymerase sigma-70 factor, ECF subfamily [Alteromonadaceae bacterium Bs31]|nr:RNA polymerase sigma-70 factor, ECF subfamily [Alteromonadaceae bacterium Bs31]
MTFNTIPPSKTATASAAQHNEPALVAQAKAGDEKAFAVLVNIYRSRLRNIIRKTVGHPDDTDELYQESLLKAATALGSYKGDSNFGTWLCAIGVNLSLDFLRKQKAWRTRAQVIYGNVCYENPEWGAEVYQAINQVEFEFDVHEHIAYCWSCVARSLPAEQNVSLVYREFLGLTNRESAKKMGLSESVFRHTLAKARASMQNSFDDLCALVSKKGVCYQCSGLREGCAEEKQGQALPANPNMAQRIRFVGEAELDSGKSQGMHDLFYRRTQELEHTGQGSEDEVSKCYSSPE